MRIFKIYIYIYILFNLLDENESFKYLINLNFNPI